MDCVKAPGPPTHRVTMFSIATAARAYALTQCSSHASAGFTPRAAAADSPLRVCGATPPAFRTVSRYRFQANHVLWY